MFLGTSDIRQAKYLLEDYVDNAEDYKFAARMRYEGVCAVWLADSPGALPYGAEGISSPMRDRRLGATRPD